MKKLLENQQILIKKTNLKKINKLKKKKTTLLQRKPIDFLEQIVIPFTNLILQDIQQESVLLYKDNRWWAFCLTYRIFLEVSFLEKIKRDHQNIYSQICEKGIVGQLKYLASNQQLVDAKHAQLRRNLHGNVLENMPQIDLMNCAAHGNYKPYQADSETLLMNTQSLLEWIFE